MDAFKLASICEDLFDIDKLSLSDSYWYASLPLCLIDAVFSIGVKYTSTQNVVKRYCTYCGLKEYNRDRGKCGDSHKISDMIRVIEKVGVEKSADDVFGNRQRTSSRNGILKAEAALRIARILRQDGIEDFSDLWKRGISKDAEKEIKKVPGQSSGLALSYFYMLAGDDSLAKPDRHIIRFLSKYIGYTPDIHAAQELLTKIVAVLRKKYPRVTVRLLDYTIWNYMSSKRNLELERVTKEIKQRSTHGGTTMKVLLLNGSPKANGNTALALKEMETIFLQEGIEVETVQVGDKEIRGCVSCYGCGKAGKCVFDDLVNEVADKLREADGLVVGSPVYFASPNGTLLALLDRLFFSAPYDMTMKVGASVAVARRGGCSATFDALNKYFTISGMPVASSQYWNSVHGRDVGEAAQDAEGLQTMRTLARNMTFLMKSIALGKEQFGLPAKEEKKQVTNFIR